MPDRPDGWFGTTDMKYYRSIVEKLPDNANIAEIGVWKGRSLSAIADLIKKKNIKVLAIDTFKGSIDEPSLFEEASKTDIYQVFLDNMNKFSLLPCLAVMPMDSVAAANLLPDGYFDFVFIDADHSYEGVKRDLAAWFPKLNIHGVLAGHDYHINKGGVRPAVDEFFKDNKDLKLTVDGVIWATKRCHYMPKTMDCTKSKKQ